MPKIFVDTKRGLPTPPGNVAWRESRHAGRAQAGRDRIEHLQWLAHWLDEGFRFPGSQIRFGWDAIAKLLPVFGDTLGLIASLYLFSSIRSYKLPRVTMARMFTNIGIDYVVGMIPFIGAVFDVFWKPNVWNVALLRKHLAAEGPRESKRVRRHDALLVVLAAIVVVVLLGLTLAGCYWLLVQLSHWLAAARP